MSINVDVSLLYENQCIRSIDMMIGGIDKDSQQSNKLYYIS